MEIITDHGYHMNCQGQVYWGIGLHEWGEPSVAIPENTDKPGWHKQRAESNKKYYQVLVRFYRLKAFINKPKKKG